MWRELVRRSAWSSWLDLVPPALFDVLPARALGTQVQRLAANAIHGRRFAELREQTARGLAEAHVPVLVSKASPLPPDGEPIGRGPAVLRLYFFQLLHRSSAILDLRPSRFEPRDGLSMWRPSPLYLEWDPPFLDAVRRLYTGFYRGPGEPFRQALADLSLSASEDLLRKHFSEGDQRAVTFRLSTFTSTFHDVFVRCREAGAVLHPDFVALGVYLATLYEHLESLGEPQDVRAAFDAVA